MDNFAHTLLDRVITHATAMATSRTNVVVFTEDIPWLWFQYYLGLIFNVPTFVIMKRSDQRLREKFNHRLVKQFYFVEKFTDKEIDPLVKEIHKFIQSEKVKT